MRILWTDKKKKEVMDELDLISEMNLKEFKIYRSKKNKNGKA